MIRYINTDRLIDCHRWVVVLLVNQEIPVIKNIQMKVTEVVDENIAAR